VRLRLWCGGEGIMNEEIDGQREETLDPKDWKSMRALGHRKLDDAMDYVEKLRYCPVWQHAPPQVKAHFQGPPPLDPESAKVGGERTRTHAPI
jgi:aromatic-L-amino-acid/L-tryptophan decarboxylase